MHEVKSALIGVGKLKGLEVRRAKPITPVLLLAFHSIRNLSSLDDVMFFAACLVGFFGLLRKLNLFPPSQVLFSPRTCKHLSRGALVHRAWGIEIQVFWSKTIQARERVLLIPLLSMPFTRCVQWLHYNTVYFTHTLFNT